MSAGLVLRIFWNAIAVGSGSVDGHETRVFVIMRIYCVSKPFKKNTSAS
jgi:hypothetical protein